ncbi:MAG: Cna B-type domain-containing protein [Lachnospiraceae bacterium]|nr:Cna B-type domain-containing protein [Lachnospiraceae bacterium]
MILSVFPFEWVRASEQVPVEVEREVMIEEEAEPTEEPVAEPVQTQAPEPTQAPVVEQPTQAPATEAPATEATETTAPATEPGTETGTEATEAPAPSAEVTEEPTAEATVEPTIEPTLEPGTEPTAEPEEECTLTEGCILPTGHEGDCELEEACDLSENCALEKGHEGDCMTEEELLLLKDALGDEIDLEPQQAEPATIEVTTEGDKISAYFGETLSMKVSASAPMGADNYFYLKLDTDRAGLLTEVAEGETFSVTDTSGNEITLTKTADGCYFTLDNSLEDAATEFTLDFTSEEGADSTNSNPATVKVYAGMGADAETAATAADEAAAESDPAVTLTWSATSDKLQYSIDLYWKTADESKKYHQTYDTVEESGVDTTYVLNIITSSGTYDTGKMEVRLPYALWAYRDGTACVPSQISLAKMPDIPADEDVRYHYWVDDMGTPENEADDELVITNWCEVPAGTNTTIEVRYTVDPVKTIDMSIGELVAKGSATTTLQDTPEVYTTDAITYQLDTGFTLGKLSFSSTPPKPTYIYSADKLPSELRTDADFENYRYMSFNINEQYTKINQPTESLFHFEDALCDEAEVLFVKSSMSPDRGGVVKNHPVQLHPEGDTTAWSYTRPGTMYSQGSSMTSEVNSTIYVRYPATQESFQPIIYLDITTTDEDSHLVEDGDHNDIDGAQITMDEFEWVNYEYHIGELETWEKDGGNTYAGGIEIVKNGKSPGEFEWELEQSYDGNLLSEDARQKFEIYDDFHFWNLGENGAYIPMTEEDYEITQINRISCSLSVVDLSNGNSYYSDFEGGDLVIEGYRKGAWEEIQTITLEPQKASGGYLFNKGINSSGLDTNIKGRGFTRIRVKTPAVGRGKFKCNIDLYTEIKPTSPTFKAWAEANPDYTGSIYIYDVAAFKHFLTDENGNFVWNDKSAEQVTTPGGSKPSTSVCEYLATRDKAENNYGEATSDGYMLRDWDSGVLSPITYKSAIKKEIVSKTNNTDKQRAEVQFKITEAESTNMSESFATNNPEIFNAFQQTEGVFYDLLPVGYKYNTESTPTVKRYMVSNGGTGVQVTKVEAFDNWDGTGRQMVKFYVKCDEGVTNFMREQVYRYFSALHIGNNSSVYTGVSGFELTFDTYITWKDLVYTTGNEYNLVAFQSGKTIKGDSKSDSGNPEVYNNKGNPVDSTVKFLEVVGRDGNPAFCDMDGDGVITPNSTLYAYVAVSLDMATSLEVGIDKRVKGNGGIYTTIDTTNLNDTYKYRVGVTNSASGTLKDLIVYDILEEAANKEGATGEVTWKGTFQSIDTSRAVALGIAPVVYYSTADIDYNTETGSVKDTWLENTSVWSTTQPEDKSTIKAIAVDLRKKTDGSDFVLPNSGCVYFEISMTAPDTLPQMENPDKIYAINRPAYSCYRQTSTSSEGEYATVIGTRVKISIPETQRSVKKVWEDADNQDGKRPESIEIQILGDGVAYGDPVTLSEANGWAYTWEHLPKTAIGGAEITYTIEEINLPEGYTATYEEEEKVFTVTNTYTPEVVDIEGEKTWEDADNQDGKRPSSITINLLADGEKIDSVTVTPDADGNWTWSFTDLPKYKAGAVGQEIVYTITEEAVTDYETEVDGYDVINTHEPEVVDIEGEKTWEDADNQDGKRPSSITINLLADGEKIDSVTVTEADDWKWSFTELPKYKVGAVGQLVTYTITEDEVTGYETEINGYDVTNTYTPETTEVSGEKTWDDADNQDGKRPESITIRLFADGTEIDSVTVTEADDWKWSFTELPKYRDGGVEIVYTITEDEVADYDSEVDGYNVTNTHEPETTEVTVLKKWKDENDKDGLRPDSIKVQLLADGEEIGEPVVLNKANKWTYTWTDLPKYKDGVEITYTVKEISKVKGYTTTYSEDTFTITNTHKVEPTPTPTPVPEETPAPTATPSPTATPKPTETPTPTAEVTPEPETTPTPNPGETPAPTPGKTPAPSATPKPVTEVEPEQGERVEEVGIEAAVLGARRATDCAVLGKRRRPATGDDMQIFLWIGMLLMAGISATFAATQIYKGKRRGILKDE